MAKQDRSLTASEKKANDIVLKLVKLGAVPDESWNVWSMTPVSPQDLGMGTRLTRIVQVKWDRCYLELHLQDGFGFPQPSGSQGEWGANLLVIEKRSRSGHFDERFELKGWGYISFLLKLAK